MVMTRGEWGGAASLICFCLTTLPALAADPVALVEDVIGAPAGVEAMTYLAAGSVIRLGAKDGLVVDYLASCVRETISGGVVTVGSETSKVVGGKVARETVQCDGGQLNLSTRQAAQSAGVLFRQPPPKLGDPAAHPAVDRTLYGLCPLVDLPGGGRLVIERLDQPGERTEIDIPSVQLMRGTFYDFAKEGRSLAPGGIYRVSAGGRSVVLRIDPFAQPGASPLAGRLLRL